MKLDILAFGAHPDDVELGCGGTLIKHIEAGRTVGIVDLTKGEMGTRGTKEMRLEEAQDAAKIIGAKVRENLGMRDGYLTPENEEDLLKIIRIIRKYRPDIVFANALQDRHPDHGRGAELVKRAAFQAGLRKITTTLDGMVQDPWRPAKLYHYVQYWYRKPSFVVDITHQFEKRRQAILAFKSQFYDPNSDEPVTLISTDNFQKLWEARAREYGSMIFKEFGEAFEIEGPFEVDLL